MLERVVAISGRDSKAKMKGSVRKTPMMVVTANSLEGLRLVRA
jgi:hypothetical protein